MMSDQPAGAYDTGDSAFDATRNADNPVGVEAPQEAAPAVDVLPAAEPAPVGAPAPPAAIPQDTWDRAVGAWLNDHVRSSPITQGASGAWEYLNAVLPRLKALLEREL